MLQATFMIMTNSDVEMLPNLCLLFCEMFLYDRHEVLSGLTTFRYTYRLQREQRKAAFKATSGDSN